MVALESLLSNGRTEVGSVKKQSGSSSDDQREQERLVEKALEQPDVAAAMKIFTVASQYAPLPVAPPTDGLSYATGGNQS